MKLLNIVVFAEQYQELIKWYQDTLGLETLLEEHGEYHYTELGYDRKLIVGITPATEVKHTPDSPRNNAAVMQLEVDDIKRLFRTVGDNGGKILFGPAYEEQNGFYYGGITDIEGNQIWIIEASKT